VARLVEAARAAGAEVIHCIAERRADNKGMNRNARMFGYMAKAEPKLLPGSPATEIVPEVKVHESDVVLSRLHGLSPFSGTELDFVLRNLDVTTVIGVGVSVNVAIMNLTFDAVNAGYQVVVPTDAVAGTPRSYVEQVFEHTLRNAAEGEQEECEVPGRQEPEPLAEVGRIDEVRVSAHREQEIGEPVQRVLLGLVEHQIDRGEREHVAHRERQRAVEKGARPGCQRARPRREHRE
jgi:nicotinamidase-related amidase